MLVADGRKGEIRKLPMVALALITMSRDEGLNPVSVINVARWKCLHRFNSGAPCHTGDVDQLGVGITICVVLFVPEDENDVW